MNKCAIITTTYNHSKYIIELLDSVINQTFNDWVIYIGDDSLNNLTWDIILSYKLRFPDKIYCWHHEKSLGIVGNLNFLLDKAIGTADYIFFLEGDDLFINTALQEKVAIFESNKYISLVYSDLDFINSDSKLIKKEILKNSGSIFFKNEIVLPDVYFRLPNSPVISYSTIAIRSSVLREFSPVRNINGSFGYSVSDYDLVGIIASQHCIYGISHSLTKYRRHSTNESSDFSRLFSDLISLIEFLYNDGTISQSTYVYKSSHTYLLLAISEIYKGNKRKALSYFKLSRRGNFFDFFLIKLVVIGLIFLPKKMSRLIIGKKLGRL